MTQNKKIVLFIILPVIASCCLLCILAAVLIPDWVSNAVSTDPDRARQVAAKIADYALPVGYVEQMGADFFTVQMVALERPDGRGVMIMFMQFQSTGASRDQMEKQMQQAFQNQYQGKSASLTYIGERPVTIKGQPAILTISESAESAAPVRQATGVFSGRGGIAMVMVTGEISGWDWNMLDTFFQSIR
jgi:hypothetical protein